MKTLGQVAYEELWRDVFCPMGPWDRLREQTQSEWERIAAAVVKEYERRKFTDAKQWLADVKQMKEKPE